MKITVLIDLHNLYLRTRDKFCPNWRNKKQQDKEPNIPKINYQSYLDYIKDLGEINKAIAYGRGYPVDFKHFLKKVGIEAHFVGNNVDINLLIISRMTTVSDTIVLGSSNKKLIPALKNIDKKIIVIASDISEDFQKVVTETIEIPESMLE